MKKINLGYRGYTTALYKMTNRNFRQPYIPIHPLTLIDGFLCLDRVKIARFDPDSGVLSFLSHSRKSSTQVQPGEAKARVVEIDAREFGEGLLRMVEGK